MMDLEELLTSDLLVDEDQIVIRPEVLGSNYYVGRVGELSFFEYKKYMNRLVKRIDFNKTEGIELSIIITLFSEEE